MSLALALAAYVLAVAALLAVAATTDLRRLAERLEQIARRVERLEQIARYVRTPRPRA